MLTIYIYCVFIPSLEDEAFVLVLGWEWWNKVEVPRWGETCIITLALLLSMSSRCIESK
jgi:hypothetical protein